MVCFGFLSDAYSPPAGPPICSSRMRVASSKSWYMSIVLLPLYLLLAVSSCPSTASHSSSLLKSAALMDSFSGSGTFGDVLRDSGGERTPLGFPLATEFGFLLIFQTLTLVEKGMSAASFARFRKFWNFSLREETSRNASSADS